MWPAPARKRGRATVFSGRLRGQDVTSLVCLMLLALAAPPATTTLTSDPRYAVGELLFSDDFQNPLSADWFAELENGGVVATRDGKLILDVPAGCTAWFKPQLSGPVMIEYEATVVAAGGKNDRASDLNCFWMAIDTRTPQDPFATRRSGKFEEYNQLRCYYVGLGGNENTTTRFRRYVGDAQLRPLLPEHDLRDKSVLITPNRPHTIRLVACDDLIQFWRDGVRIFEMTDPKPYTSGHFAFRTVTNHMEIRNFRVYRLESKR
jgi:hypothetical protein